MPKNLALTQQQVDSALCNPHQPSCSERSSWEGRPTLSFANLPFSLVGTSVVQNSCQIDNTFIFAAVWNQLIAAAVLQIGWSAQLYGCDANRTISVRQLHIVFLITDYLLWEYPGTRTQKSSKTTIKGHKATLVGCKLRKIECLKIFSICHRCQRHWRLHIRLKISPRIFEKINKALMWCSGAGGNWFKKKPKVENLVALCGYLYVIIYTKNSYMYLSQN